MLVEEVILERKPLRFGDFESVLDRVRDVTVERSDGSSPTSDAVVVDDAAANDGVSAGSEATLGVPTDEDGIIRCWGRAEGGGVARSGGKAIRDFHNRQKSFSSPTLFFSSMSYARLCVLMSAGKRFREEQNQSKTGRQPGSHDSVPRGASLPRRGRKSGDAHYCVLPVSQFMRRLAARQM